MAESRIDIEDPRSAKGGHNRVQDENTRSRVAAIHSEFANRQQTGRWVAALLSLAIVVAISVPLATRSNREPSGWIKKGQILKADGDDDRKHLFGSTVSASGNVSLIAIQQSNDAKLFAYNVTSWEEHSILSTTLDEHLFGPVNGFSISDDGTVFLYGQRVYDFDASIGNWTGRRNTVPLPNTGFNLLSLSGDGSTILVVPSSHHKLVKVYRYSHTDDYYYWRQLGQGLEQVNYLSFHSHYISKNGQVIAYNKDDQIVAVHRYANERDEWVLMGPTIVRNETFAPENDKTTSTQLISWEQVTSLSLSDDGSILAIASHFQPFSWGTLQKAVLKVYKYNAETGKWTQLGQRLQGLEGQFMPKVSLSGDGATLAFNKDEYPYSGFSVYDFQNGTLWQERGRGVRFRLEDFSSSDLILSQDGNVVVWSMSGSGQVRVYGWRGRENW
jgi:hypothetical protein